MLFKCIYAPARLRPNTAANASNAEPSNLNRASRCSEGFGSQTATKSPPGPNLQSGSACLSLSGIIFLFRVVSRASCPRSEGGTPSTRFFKFVLSQMFYRQGVLIYPNKNRTKISRIRTFFPPRSFYSDSCKNMGLQRGIFCRGSSIPRTKTALVIPFFPAVALEHLQALEIGFDWLCFLRLRGLAFCHILLSHKTLRQFALLKLGLFFQITFRSTQHAEPSTKQLGLFFQIGFSTPQRCWGLTEIGFVFTKCPIHFIPRILLL